MHARSRLAGAVAALCVGTLTTACSTGGPSDPQNDPSRSTQSATPSQTPSNRPSPTGEPTRLTFGVFGNAEEIETWQTAVDSYNSVYGADVRLRTWSSWREADAAMRADRDVPDVFMLNERDLSWYLEQELTQPVDELLDERGVNFGDDFSRDAMEGFSVGTSLACMPLSMSPRVVYVNTDLVDFATMRERGLDVPSSTERWTFDQFATAADFAAKPRRAIKGVYVDPTLDGLAPFILSGGGQVYDDTEEPTSLAFSSEESRAALERTLTVLRDAQLTPTQVDLADTTPQQMFMDGDLAMITGYRDLTPRLRQQEDLNFDVMPMPVLDSGATVGSLEGMCLDADTEDTAAAADFMAFALSESTLRGLARAGRTVPASVGVASSPDFLQSWEDPQNAAAFVAGMRNVERQPPGVDPDAVNRAVQPQLRELLTEPVLDLPSLTTEIDAASRRVLSPETATESPTE